MVTFDIFTHSQLFFLGTSIMFQQYLLDVFETATFPSLPTRNSDPFQGLVP